MLKPQNIIDIEAISLLLFINFLIKTSSGCAVAMLQNKQLAEELHKSIIKKFKRRTVYSLFKDFDLSDMQLISKFNKRIRFYYL